MARHYLSDEVKALVAADYQRGERFVALAKKYNIGTSTLFRILKQFRVKSRLGDDPDKVDVRRSLTSKAESEIINKYQTGIVPEQLAFEYNVSEWTIIATLRRYGIKRRGLGSGVVTEAEKANRSQRARHRWTNAEIRKKYLPLLLRTGFQVTGIQRNKPLNNKRYKQFRAAIFSRDGNACVRCWSREKLDIHHKIHRITRPDLVFDPANVETLCHSCHMREEANRKHNQRRKETA
jgi:Mor family transcriptional regulator